VRDLMSQGQIQFVEIVKIATQVASALAAAHKAGIVHRDIKPENVMLRPDGYVKVLDFGLAKLTDASRKAGSGGFAPSGLNQTVPGMIMGTPSYMSPEQAEGLETDARTDIWAVGALLYEMASGRVPTTTQARRRASGAATPPWVASCEPSVRSALPSRALLRKCLSRC
jgi:serine/threonine protein kinase